MPPPRPSLDDLLRNQEPARLIPSYNLKLKEQRHWHGRSQHTQATLADENWRLVSDNGAELTRFEIVAQRGLSAKFRSRKQFVALLEKLVNDYYTDVGQHLRAWQEPPPQVEERGEGAETKGASAGTA